MPIQDPDLADRLRAVQGLQAQRKDNPELDSLVCQAAAALKAPMALLSILDADRQWFKAKIGVTVSETPLASSFCLHAIRGSGVFVVRDATTDQRFATNPLVTGQPNIRFYAGAPVRVNGIRVGSLCVLDTQPRAAVAEFHTRYLAHLAEKATTFLINEARVQRASAVGSRCAP